MLGKKWLIVFFGFIVFYIVGLELIYQNIKTPDMFETEVDANINIKAVTSYNKPYETLVLGDSIARAMFRNVNIHNTVLNLSLNGTVSMMGQYFILKRYLSYNKPPKNVYVLATPYLLDNNLQNELNAVYYFFSSFREKEERKEIKEIKPEFYEYALSKSSAGFSRIIKKKFNIIKDFIIASSGKPSYKDIGSVIDWDVTEDELNELKRENFTNKNIQNRIMRFQSHANKLKLIPKIYLIKLQKLANENGINLTIVLNPIPEELNNIFKKSALYAFIRSINIDFININDYYSFNNYFFQQDGIHFFGKVNDFYRQLIDQYVVDIYENRD